MKATDVLDTLTGWDEVALRKTTGIDLDEMHSSTLVRAMAAVHMSRTSPEEEGLTLPLAWNKVQKMTRTELGAWFEAIEEDEGEEVLDDEPVTEAGKDDSANESPQTS